MPTTVDVDGVGEVEFPDTMSQDEIHSALTSHFSPKTQPVNDFGALKDQLSQPPRTGEERAARDVAAASVAGLTTGNVPSERPDLMQQGTELLGKGVAQAVNIIPNTIDTIGRVTGSPSLAMKPWVEQGKPVPGVSMISDAVKNAVKAVITPKDVNGLPIPGDHPAVEGISQSVKAAVDSFGTPEGLATLPLLELKAARAIMAGDSALKTPEQIRQTVAVIQDPKATAEQKWKAIADSGVNLGMTAALGLSLRGGHGEAPAEAKPVETAEPVVPPVEQPMPVAASNAPVEVPINPGGPVSALPPEKQAIAQQNNNPAAWGDFKAKVDEQAAEGHTLETIKDLQDRGYADSEIGAMTPQQAAEALAVKPSVSTNSSTAATESKGSRRVDFPPDIISDIKDGYGKIKPKGDSTSGEHYRGTYASAKKVRPELFSESGSRPDEIVENLQRDGKVGPDFTVDDLWDAINKAHDQRGAFSRGELPEQQQEKFQNALVKNSKKPSNSAVSISELSVGDKFKLQGEEFTVSDINPDNGEVEVQDGRKFGRQTIPEGAPIHADANTLQVKSTSTDFLPEEQPAEMVGMGGAVPSEFENNPNTATSIKNAAVDAERAKRGLPPAMEPARRGFGEVWDRAMAKIDQDPEFQDRLIDELRDHPRALTDLEDAMLLHRQIDLQNEYGRATRDLAQAFDDGRLDDVTERKLQVARLSDQLLDIYNIGKRSGTETGRGLNARKMAAFEDFSLANMEVESRAAKGGRPLTADELSTLQKQHAEIHEKQKALEEHVAKQQAKISELEANKAIDSLLNVDNQGYNPVVLQMAGRLVKFLDTKADLARGRLKGRLKWTSAGVDPLILKDLAEIGASHVAHVGYDLAKWSARMVSDLGESIRPHLEELWSATKHHLDHIEDHFEKPVRQTVKKAVKKLVSVVEKQTAVKEAISTRIKEGKPDTISKLVQMLARTFVEQGIKNRDALTDAVHGVLKEIDPTMTRRDTMDAISGYGKFSQLSKDAVSVELRDLKGQMQQVAKLEDIQAKKPLQKTGVERRSQSDEERRLIQQVNEAKRRHGVVVTDPARQLKSSLDAIKTNLRNRISDLEYQIAQGKKTVKSKTSTPLDAEAAALKAEKQKLQEQFDAIFGKPELTDAQRVAIAKNALEKSIADYDRRIKEGDLSTKKTASKTPNTPELQVLKAQRDALREQFQELKANTPDSIAAKEQKALEAQKETLEKQIAEQERRLREGDLATKGATVNRPARPELEALKQQRDALSKRISEARKKPSEQQSAEKMQRELDAINKRIAETIDKVMAGDLSRAPSNQKLNRPMSPELEQAKQNLEAVNKRLEEMRKDAIVKKSPEAVANQSLRTRLTNRIAELEAKTAAGDFSTKPKRSLVLDPETLKVQADYERVKKSYEQSKEKARLAGRSLPRKIADIALRIRREFVLSMPSSILKLASYSAQEMALGPLKELVGAGLSKLPFIDKVAAKSSSEVGFNLGDIVEDYTQAFTQGIKDAKDTLTKGGSDLKVKYDPAFKSEPEFRAFFGTLHQMEKSPLLRLAFTRSFRRRMEFNAKNGVNITDGSVMQRIGVEAYQDALRAALINRNEVVNKVNRFVNSLEEKSKATGRMPLLGATAKFVFNAETPVQHVPVNYIARTGEYIFGALTGSAKTAMAFRRGIETLQPEEANQIMRHLKSGAVGSAAMAIGFFAPQIFGGLWTPTRDKKQPLKPGEIQLGGLTVPRSATHDQFLNAAQFGATVRQIADSKLSKKNPDVMGLGAGAMGALFGLVDEMPYMQEIEAYGKLKDPATRGKFAGEKLKGYLVPGGISQVAEWFDTNDAGQKINRNPTTLLQHVESGIPGLRKEVPVNAKKPVKD